MLRLSKRNKGTKGAVSIFLVLILVPCIVVTSVFVDLGRVHMSKGMAASAGDLALNTLMTNFDADLKEWYGMAASCQNIEEFYTVSAQFFLRTLSSQGLSEDEIKLLSDYYAAATSDDTIYDLLQTDCQTAPSDMIKAVDDANLTNPTMIKDQVVEFMKYRAPIEMTISIIDRLQKDTSVTEAMEAEENEPLTEKKTEFYEAEGELLAAALNSYIAIYDFYSAARSLGLDNNKLQEYANKLSTYKNTYAEIHRLTVSNLLNTEGLQAYNRVTAALDKYNSSYDEKNSDIYSSKKTIRGVTYYYINNAKAKTLLDNLSSKIDAFNTAKSNYETAAATLMGNQPGTGDAQAYAIQWWVQMNQAVNAANGYTSSVSSAADEMLCAYSKVLAMKKCTVDPGATADWSTRYDELTAKVVQIQGKYLTASISDSSDAYLNAVGKLEEVSQANLSKISPSSLTVTVDGTSKNIEEAISYINTELVTIKTNLESVISCLDIAIDGNESDRSVDKYDRVKSLDALLGLVENYNKTKNAWENTANTTGTHMAEENRTEINQIDAETYGAITSESVGKLKTRLINIRSQLQTVHSAINTMTYGGTALTGIGTFAAFKTAALTKVSTTAIPLKNSELNNYATSTFGELFRPTEATVVTLLHMDENDYNLTINPESGEVATPELFVYFHRKFRGISKQDVKEKQKELDDAKDSRKEKADEAKDKGRYQGGGEEIVKDFSADGNFNLGADALAGILDLINALINLDITNIRDDLYVTTYIMDMFSYATYENEGLYSLISEKKELTLKNYPGKYQDEAIMGKTGKENNTWLSERPQDFYNKSLTLQMINKSNNAAYCAEVEYILYGGREGCGNAENVKAVYNNIYGIRYVLNLVSAFANFWPADKNNTAMALELIGKTISLATHGIIPKELTKVILIPILTVFETANDLERLEAGFPVELYKKTSAQWWIKVPEGEGGKVESVGGFLNILSNPIEPKNTDEGIFYSDYLTLFVYLGLKGSSAEAMYQRMAEVIQANMRKLSGESSYSMEKARLYFRLNSTIRVRPLMITLPFFKFDEYQNNMDTKTDWCTYELSTIRGYS